MSEQNEQTAQQSTLPGENVLVRAAGETIGEQYSLVKASGQTDFQIQILNFETAALKKGYEVQGFRVPQFDVVMGQDSQIVGALAGGLGDARTDFRDVVINFDLLNTPEGIQFQVMVRRLSDQKASLWVSMDQVTNGTAV